jgi:glycosyltransferase involved in cell wall biosynthesis
MRVLWISYLPAAICQKHGDQSLKNFFTHPAPWISSHLPPPENIELHIACLHPGGAKKSQFQELGALWHLIPAPSNGRAARFFTSDHKYYEPLLTEISPDIIHAWGTEDSNAIVASKLLPERTVIGVQGLVNKYLFVSGLSGFARMMVCSIMEILTLSRAKHVVAESEFSMKSAKFFARRAKLHVVQHPVRQEIQAVDWRCLRSRRILYVGSLSPRKGIRQALVAFSRSPTENWEFHIAGTGESRYVAKLKALSKRLGIAERVKFRGMLESDELITEMQTTPIFLLPTKSDTGPTALKEAICMGMWPICFDNSGPAEYINLLKWGNLARNLDQQDLSSKLSSAITGKPWENYPEDGHPVKQARDIFSWQNAWKNLSPIYENLYKGYGDT